MSFSWTLGRVLDNTHVVGLDMGSHTIKVAELRSKKSIYELVSLGSLCLPPGTIVEGDIIDPYTVEEALKELFSKEKIKQKEVSFVISGPEITSKKISIPKISVEELESQLTTIAAQYLPQNVDEMNIDYQILPLKEETQKMDLILTSVKKTYVENYKTVVEAADLKPVAVETAPSALACLFSILHPCAYAKTTLLLHCGASTTHFVVIENNHAVFSQSLNFGGNQITEDLREKMKLSFTEAEALKVSSPKEKHLLVEASESIAHSVQNLCHEIERTLEFYINQYPDRDIEKIYLCGGTSRIPPLRDRVEELSGIETLFLKPFETILYDEKRWNENSMDVLGATTPIALGLATRRNV